MSNATLAEAGGEGKLETGLARTSPGTMALIRKELRELALPAAALVAVSLVIALLDYLHCRFSLRYQGPGVALKVWLVISVALAFRGGAAAIARETRQRLVFLTAWPQSRLRLWVVKAAVSFMLTMAVIAVGFGVCLVGLACEGGKQPPDLGEAAQGLSLFLPLCFAFGLLWSGLVGSVLGAAALGFVTCAAIFGGGAAFFMLYVPWRWGPWVGSLGTNGDEGTGGTMVLLAMTLVAGAWAFARYPILETKRRIGWALGLLGGMALLGCVAFVGWAVYAHRPSLERGIVGEAGLTAEGKLLWFTTKYGGGRDPGGLWVAPVADGKPRLVCRAGGAEVSETAGGLVLQWRPASTANWALDSTTGRLWRLRGEAHSSSADGQYWATWERGTMVVQDRDGRVVKTINDDGQLVFAPDNRTAYYWLQEGRVMALDLQTREETEVLRMAQRNFPIAVSPDSRALLATAQDRKGGANRTTVLDLTTRRQTSLPRVALRMQPFVSGRYAWGQTRERESDFRTTGVAVVDVPAQRVVRTILASVLGGPPLAPWHREGVPYVVFPSMAEKQPPTQWAGPRKLWLARPDGTGLKLLRQERRRVLGMTPEGKLILWDRPDVEQPGLTMVENRRLGRTFVSWDPLTGAEAVLLRLP